MLTLLAEFQYFGQTEYTDPNVNQPIDGNLLYLEDKTNAYTFVDVVKSAGFKKVRSSVHNFGITNSAIWFKLSVKNSTDFENLILQVNQPIIDQIDLFARHPKTAKYTVVSMGEHSPFWLRKYQTPEYLFDVVVPKDSTVQVYLRVKCKENLQVPIFIGTRISIINKSVTSNLSSGIYFGIMIVMILYNLFIFATLRDRNYVLYSIYIVFILFTQSSLQGYTFQLIWPDIPWLAIHSPFLLPALVGVIGLEFFKQFLKLEERMPFANKLSYLFLMPYTVSLVLGFTVNYQWSFRIMEITASLVSVFMLVVAFLIYKRGFSEARFFLLGWFVFLVGICIYVMKDFEILPYNNFTRYTMHFGSAVEVILLSFALADRINILKKEKEQSQAEALSISQQNQTLVKEQNIRLEQKVHERTNDLEIANEELTLTLNHLKDTQSQLVDAEKMASLGQLTAGIAHEINNPINFVSANLRPLRMDIVDVLNLVKKYDEISPNGHLESKLEEINDFKKRIDIDYVKKEIETLLNGIEEGARRTAEIVSGLKNFSRLDETDLKLANINEGIESTLIILKSAIPAHTKVIKHLGPIPDIECLPGKLNQVFMNLLSNAIYAIKQNHATDQHQLIISTSFANDKVYVTIEDTGIGMTPEVKAKIFEPFFTTKDVGEGTGLGMSIVFKIIETHHAKMDIETEYGKGTKMILILNTKLV